MTNRRPQNRRVRRRKRTARRRFWRFVNNGGLVILFFAVVSITLITVSSIFAIHAIMERRSADSDVDDEVFVTGDIYDENPVTEEQEIDIPEPVDPEVASFAPGYIFEKSDRYQKLPEFLEDGTGSSIVSQYAALVDVDSNEIIAGRAPYTVINPASMTKVLTLLVAVENIDNIDDKVVITDDITQYTYDHDCSVVGFSPGEKVTVRDLLYGTILPSGADAVLALCNYVAGSQDEFVAMMNEKVDELGLSETAHFTNATGLYDEAHHCTPVDMAVIMKAALMHDICRDVLYARTYTTRKTKEHPDGILISNWFLRRIEDKAMPGEISGAKTGFVKESGNCAVSYLVGDDGRHYICATGWSTSAWRCIYDHVDIYNGYAGQ